MNKKIKSYLLTESSYPAKLVATKTPAGSPPLFAGLPSGTHGQSFRYDLLLILCILLVPLGLFVLFDGCKNNPVVQNSSQTVDTISKYKWVIDTIINSNINDLFIVDTNNIYFSSTPSPIYYNGLSYVSVDMQDPNFLCYSVGGFDKYNVYFSGQTNNTGVLKKWDGNSITTYNINGDNVKCLISITSSNDGSLWLVSADTNLVYHFISGSFIKYTLDDGNVSNGQFYFNSSQELFLFEKKGLNDTLFYYNYKFMNDGFVRLSITPTCGTCNLYSKLNFCNNDILNITGYKIFYFDEGNWKDYLNTLQNTFNSPPNQVGGDSRNNFFCFYTDAYPYMYSLLEYNNNRWCWEKDLKLLDVQSSQIKMFENKLYIILNYYNNSLVAKGTKK